MFRGIYGSISAMLVQEKAVDVASNNLANANTSGFSKSLAIAKTFPTTELVKTGGSGAGFGGDTAIGRTSLGVVLSETAVDNTPGIVVHSGNPLDCAIEGEGYFQVTDGADNYYTRCGNFSLDNQGNLVTPSGLMLVGDGGPITAGEAGSVEITSDGTVRADGEDLGRIAVFRFENPSYLLRRGSSLMAQTADSGQPVAVDGGQVKLVPGSVEGSNVNVVEEMTRMMEANRAYEAASKAFETGTESGRKMIDAFGT